MLGHVGLNAPRAQLPPPAAIPHPSSEILHQARQARGQTAVLGSSFLVPRSWFLVLGSSFLVLGSWFCLRHASPKRVIYNINKICHYEDGIIHNVC